MNREDIIRMAREANVYDAAESELNLDYTFTGTDLERFAALVEEETAKQMLLMIGYAAEAEREACARVVEQYCGAWDDQGYALTAAIRARGNDE